MAARTRAWQRAGRLSAPLTQPRSLTVDDKRAKNRFGWVKRLMQGQGGRATGAHERPLKRTPAESPSLRFADDDDSVQSVDTATRGSLHSNTTTTALYMDNASTTPLKSITSTPLTKSPSVLSGGAHDNTLFVASTVDTSITPTMTQSQSHQGAMPSVAPPGTHAHPQSNPSGAASVAASGGGDRDSESIVTLASSSRRLRRRSLDTNCSTAGIPPASIMERLSVNPTAANSNYAVSIDRGSNRGSDDAASEQ